MTIIRCSQLTSFADCGLRSAVNAWWSEFTALGYEPRVLATSAALAVGSGTHGSIAATMLDKKNGITVDLKRSTERGIFEFDEKIKNSYLIPDELTPDKNSAYKQIDKLARSYYSTFGYRAKPLHVEEKHTVVLKGVAPGYELQGTLDQIIQEDFLTLLDAKTGKVKRIHPEQVAGYNFLAKDRKIYLRALGDIFLKRKNADQDADRPILTYYPIAAAEALAKARIKQIVQAHQEFKRTGNPLAFPTNHMSMMCDAKYCSAFGTPICPVGMIKAKVKSQS